MIGRVAAPAAAKAVASAPVQAIWGAQRGVVYVGGMAGLNKAVLQEAMKYGVRKEVVQWAKAHPTIVPFINADKDMIHSIAETGWTRWLVGDGNGYFDTKYKPNQDTIIETEYKIRNGGCKVLYGVCEGSPSATNANGLLKIYNSPNRYGFGMGDGTTIEFAEGSEIGVRYKLRQQKNELYINGLKKLTMPIVQATWSNTRSLWLYARNGGTLFNSDDAKRYFSIEDNNESHLFLPCLHNGNMELLDVVTGTFATRVGTFTQSLEQNPQE